MLQFHLNFHHLKQIRIIVKEARHGKFTSIYQTINLYRTDEILPTAFSNAFAWMKIFEFRLKFHWSLFNNIPAWRRPGDKPLFEPMPVRSLTELVNQTTYKNKAWISNYIPLFYVDVITYSCHGLYSADIRALLLMQLIWNQSWISNHGPNGEVIPLPRPGAVSI